MARSGGRSVDRSVRRSVGGGGNAHPFSSMRNAGVKVMELSFNDMMRGLPPLCEKFSVPEVDIFVRVAG